MVTGHTGGGRERTWGGAVRLPENAAAVLAARRVLRALRDPARRRPPAPLALHGPPGCGKSAVAAALVRKLAASPIALSARVVPARDVLHDPADLADLKAVDLLVIEDIQHLPAKAAAGLEQLLDARTRRRRPTVVTAPSGPAELAGLPRRLTSRLSAGLVVAVDPLGPASRRVLIARHARTRRLALAPDALDWLAARPTGGGIRPALGAVERLSVLARGAAEALDAATAERLLADPDPTESDPSVAHGIVRRVADRFGVSVREVLGPSRLPSAVMPRQVAMLLLRDLTSLSLPKVGAIVGGRDHTTVLHGCRKAAEAVAADPELARLVERIRGELR